ncbi:MAG: hypothetical protein R6V58_12770 [Planctomycetota bacterium]
MLTLRISRHEETSVLPARSIPVFVDGRRRRDLRVERCELLAGPDFGRARLVRQGPVELPLPPIGSEVLLTDGDAAGDVEFRGVVASAETGIGEQAGQARLEIRHVLAEKLSGKVTTCHQLTDGEPGEIDRSRVVFNAGAETLASPEDYQVNGFETPVFSSSAGARRWTVADVLAYLLAGWVPADVEVQSVEELRELAGDIDAGELELTNLSIAEALASTAARAALRLRAARAGLGLVFYRPGRQGRLRSVRLQPPGGKVTPSGSNLWRGRLEFHRRPGRRGVLALGGHKHYEATFELSPGWDPAKQTNRWRDFVRGAASDWPAVADVYRKWVLNEHGRYGGPPWNLPTWDFSAIDAESFTTAVPRRFLPCVSRDAGGRSPGIVVEVRYGPDQPWRRWPLPAWACDDECAVLLGGDALPADFFAAALEATAQVRVTATVRSDAALTAEVGGEANLPVETVDFSDRAMWRGVSELSVFHGRDDLGEPDERDDSAMLAELARRYAETVSSAVEARLTLGRVDTSFHIGDRVERIDGRDIELGSYPGAVAAIGAVSHDTDSQTTELLLTG